MYATENKLRLIEELTLNHWQPLSTSLYDGWVLVLPKDIRNVPTPFNRSILLLWMCMKRLRHVRISIRRTSYIPFLK